jgi:hypothetical protein
MNTPPARRKAHSRAIMILKEPLIVISPSANNKMDLFIDIISLFVRLIKNG